MVRSCIDLRQKQRQLKSKKKSNQFSDINMSGYFIVRCEYFDESEYKDYAKLAADAVKEFNGEFLVTGRGAQNQMESGVLPKTVVVKFKTFEDALSCYQCEAYEKALSFIENSSNRDFVIVEGLD